MWFLFFKSDTEWQILKLWTKLELFGVLYVLSIFDLNIYYILQNFGGIYTLKYKSLLWIPISN